MALRYEFIPPQQYGFDPADFVVAMKSASGIPMLAAKTSAAAARANVTLSIPIPIKIDAAGIGAAIKQVDLWHYVSAASAGVTPISAGGGTVNFREILVVTGTLMTTGALVTSAGTVSAGVFNVPNSLAGGGLPAALVSGTAWSPTTLSAAGVAIASLWTSAMLETFTPCVIPAEKSGQTGPYIPRNSHALLMCISASLAASAVWEHYGCLVTYT